MTRAQIRTVAGALFHDGIDVDKLSETAKDELREAVEVLLSCPSPSVSRPHGGTDENSH